MKIFLPFATLDLVNRIYQGPHRLFFSLGAILALAGISPWLLQLFPDAPYPIEFHRQMMINGFVLSFVIGFAMTSIPKVTNTEAPTSYQILPQIIYLLASAFFTFKGYTKLHFLFAGLALQNLLFLYVKRFRDPPPTFIFSAIGVFVWMFTNYIFALDRFLLEWMAIFNDIFSNAAPLAIALGVSAQIIPDLIGSKQNTNRFENKFISIILSIIFFGSYVLEKFFPFNISLACRALVIFYFAFGIWKIHRLPHNKNNLSWGIWFCCWMYIIGAGLTLFWTEQYIHALHAILVGGFSLMIFLMSLVTLKVEKTSRVIAWMTALMITAGATRAFAPVIQKIYLKHLAYSAVLWITGCILWIVLVLPLLVRVRNDK